MNPKISIIVPVYKAEKYIAKCIDSIKNQTSTNWELLLIDDGSPDMSGNICDKMSIGVENIRVFHKKNGGVSIARNLGLEQCKGEFILFVDSDDWIAPNTIEMLTQSTLNNNYDIVLFDTTVVNPSSVKTLRNVDITNQKDFLLKILSREIGGGICGKLIKRSIIGDIRFIPGQILAEDALFMTLVADQANKVGQIHESLYFYNCTEPNSTTRTFSKKHLEDSLLTGRILKDYFSERGAEYIDAFKRYEATNIGHKILSVAAFDNMNKEYTELRNMAEQVQSSYVKKVPWKYRFVYYIKSKTIISLIVKLSNIIYE